MNRNGEIGIEDWRTEGKDCRTWNEVIFRNCSTGQVTFTYKKILVQNVTQAKVGNFAIAKLMFSISWNIQFGNILLKKIFSAKELGLKIYFDRLSMGNYN